SGRRSAHTAGELSVRKLWLGLLKKGTLPVSCLAIFAIPALAQEASAPPTVEELKTAIDGVQTNANILWTMVAASLVFLMQAGFAMVETGFTRAKNAGNIMMKNLMDFSLGGLAFWMIGFGLMFGASNGFTGWSSFF